MKDAKLTPRIAETARGLWTVYFALSGACLLAYRVAGMNWRDAFMHMCTTMGLGGFSSHDASFGHWNSAADRGRRHRLHGAVGVSFARYFIVWRNRSPMTLLRDTEVRAYVGRAARIDRAGQRHARRLWHLRRLPGALRAAAFHVVSLATTTGYAATDYLLWPVFAPVLLIFLGCFVTWCAGSTGGGIKMVRMLLLVKQARRELVRIIHPRVVNPVTLGTSTVPAGVLAAVLAFMLIYGASTVGLTMLLLLSGLDLVTAFSAVIVTLNNIGPGWGWSG